MESFATGLKRIQDACDKVGCKVEYRGDDYGFTVGFHRHCGEGWGTGVSANVPHSGTHDGTHHEEKIREFYESSILAMVKSNNRITRKEMAEKLSISLRSLQRIINAMDELHYIGSGNHGHWEIRNDQY